MKMFSEENEHGIGELFVFPYVIALLQIPSAFTLLHSPLRQLIACEDLWLCKKEILKCLFSFDSSLTAKCVCVCTCVCMSPAVIAIKTPAQFLLTLTEET